MSARKSRIRAGVSAAVLLLVCSAGAPRPAAAQLRSMIVNITAPANGSTVSGTTNVQASVTIVGLLTVQSVQFKLDGANLGAADTSAPYAVAWNTTTATNGSHTLTAVARDLLGLQFTSQPVTVTVSNAPPPDTTQPSVSVTSPAPGATVSGTITLAASATDNVGVVGVQFMRDGVNVGAEDTSAPYSASWNTTTVSNGSHSITARARDAAGNTRTSSAVSVTVSNTTPDTTQPTVSVTSPTSGATVSGTITVTASASDNVGVVGVQFLRDGVNLGAEDTTAPYSAPWDTTTAANGSHTLSARARDAAGNTRTSSAVSVTVSNGPPPDTTRPTVTLTAPASGATVSGTTAVTASASDNVGVAGVRFFLDGSPLGAEDTAAPYSVAWDTTTTANGSHTLSARARDAAGNTADTTPITVTVSNTSSGTVTRVQQTAAVVTYAGSWTHGDQSFAWSGGTASFSRGGAGMSATLTFTGTKVEWIGWREARGGMARVLLDGVVVANVDLYSATAEISVPVFTSATLPEGSHTLVIEATGAKNAAAADSIVVVDAFDVTSTAPPPPPPPTGGRHQETDSAIVYAGAWFEETTFGWTDGRAMFAVNEGTATFTFTGTGVTWIGYRGHYGGIVRVFIDGAQVAEIDTYTTGDQAGVPVYSATGLTPGTHAIRIELTPMKNPAADASETAIDAFDVTP